MSCMGNKRKKNSVSPSFYTIFVKCCFCFDFVAVLFHSYRLLCICAPDIFQCDFCFFFSVLNYVLSIFNGRYSYSADTLHTYLTNVIHSSSSSSYNYYSNFFFLIVLGSSSLFIFLFSFRNFA